MKIIIVAVLGLISMLLSPPSASGQDMKNYYALKIGVYGFRDTLRDADFDVGFDSEIVYGRYLCPNLALEAGVGYFHDGVNKGYGNSVKGTPILLTAKGIYPLKGLELFGGAGIGVYLVRFHGEVHGNYGNTGDTVFGGHFVAGTNINISQRVFIGIEGKYVITGKANFEVLRSSLDGYTATAGLGLRF